MDEKNGNTPSDALREWVRRARADEHMDLRELDSIADCIDTEMVELPKDADGVPINVGDTVYGCKSGCQFQVEVLHFEDAWGLSTNRGFVSDASIVTHAIHDSWDSIADELERYVNDSCSEDEIDGMTASTLVDFAERIRKLAKEGE